jgi:hypothetical protein
MEMFGGNPVRRGLLSKYMALVVRFGKNICEGYV